MVKLDSSRRTVAKWAAAVGLPVVLVLLLTWYTSDPKLFLEYLKALVWPAAVVAVAWRFRDLLSGKLRQLIEANVLGQTVRFAIEEKSTEALNEQLEEPANVLITWPPFPRDRATGADDEAARREAEEQKRRDSFEKTLQQAAKWGWQLAQAGHVSPPIPQVTWDEDGKPRIAHELAPVERWTWRGTIMLPPGEVETRLARTIEEFIRKPPSARDESDESG